MHRDSDRLYYRDRAEAELEHAHRAAHEAAGRAHFLLAGLYFDRAFGQRDDEPPAPSQPPPECAEREANNVLCAIRVAANGAQ
jgi:hypothetical protein